MECKRCGYKWDSRVKEPRACPRCKSYLYKTEKEESANVEEK